MMKRSVVVGTMSAFSATACFADPPRYPVEQYCREVADVSGGSAMIFNTCIDMEQAAYDNLKRNWNAISASNALRKWSSEKGLSLREKNLLTGLYLRSLFSTSKRGSSFFPFRGGHVEAAP